MKASKSRIWYIEHMQNGTLPQTPAGAETRDTASQPRRPCGAAKKPAVIMMRTAYTLLQLLNSDSYEEL